MININLSNQSSEAVHQKFSFFTEQQWETEKNKFKQHLNGLFSAKKDEIFIVLEDDGVHFLIGLGKDPKDFEIQTAAEKFTYDFRKKIKAENTLINSDNFNSDQVENLVKGLFLGTYTYPFKSEHPLFNSNFSLQVNSLSEEHLKNLQVKINALCEGQFACMEWLNKPQNFKRVPHISGFLNEISDKYNFKQTIFDRKKSEEVGLGAFLSVNQGSSQEAAFTILEYRCENANAKTVGLVGKCVLFDTGGISIKGSENLHYMKSDMGGATAVIGTLIAAAKMKLPVNIIAILPITDNAVSNTAYIPSDVITAYNGKTIEVLNTDAEGRKIGRAHV